jgi:hypothetical protein
LVRVDLVAGCSGGIYRINLTNLTNRINLN